MARPRAPRYRGAVRGSQQPLYIDTDEALAQVCERLLREGAIAVDTESNPLFAYADRLCLVQISTPRHDYLIDPLAGVNLALLSPIFADPGIVKVFHDAEFDLLMLRRVHPFEVSALFDTRVAAAALGMTRLGLGAMLEDFFGVTLDKRYQRSDWGKRPLTEGQVHYAVQDTRHLLQLAAELRARLLVAGEPAVLEVATECRRLSTLQPPVKQFDPDEYLRIRGVESLDGHALRILRELFVMRHEIAARRDVPAFKVLSNEMLFDLARAAPMDADEMAAIKTLPQKLAQRYGDAILETVRRAHHMKRLEIPPRRGTQVDELPPEARDTYERLREWRRNTARRRPTDPSLVLTRSSMLLLAALDPKPRDVTELAVTGLLEPWRLKWYGEELVAVLWKRRGRA